MITLYREQICAAGDRIEDRLADMVVAHRVVIVDGAAEAERRDLPSIQDGAEIFSGQEAVEACLARIERRMELWSRYQSDSCYIGEDDEIC